MDDDGRGRGDFILKTLQEGQQFMRSVLDENTRLRTANAELADRVTALEREMERAQRDQPAAPELSRDQKRLLAEFTKVKDQLRQVEAENREFADTFVQIEQRNSSLANLYVASYQLHSTLDFLQVVQYIKEIVINLVGSECFGLYVFAEKPRGFSRLAHEGLDGLEHGRLPIVGIVEEAMKTCQAVFLPEEDRVEGSDMPIACIPLFIHEEVIGMIAIFELLGHKDGMTDLDTELFQLLGGQAATALYSAKLFHQSKRKLDTLEGFLGLLKTK